MNLIDGILASGEEARAFLQELDARIAEELSLEALPREAVIAACDALSKSVSEEEHLPLLLATGMEKHKAEEELRVCRLQLSRAYLEARLRIELCEADRSFQPVDADKPVRHRAAPLGVLLHVTAGNADALPVYSVLDGLLTENINLVKLPGDENGLSVWLLMELMRVEPRIARRVFAFDFPSSDTQSMQRLASVADGIVVWGGDEAVRGMRALAAPGVRLVEWGHKSSFAYVSGDIAEGDLEALANNICSTEQLYCSSCQGVYLDTDSYEDVRAFAKRFLDILERVSAGFVRADDLFISAQRTIELYTRELESGGGEREVFRGERSAVAAERGMALAQSLQFRCPWVKPLPKERILTELRPNRGHLQTCALYCEDADRALLERLLTGAGVVRFASGDDMSRVTCGQPHDGEYALGRLQKIVSFE